MSSSSVSRDAAADRALAERFHVADDATMRLVYERFGGAVHTVAMAIVGDRGRSADVVQTTFLKAWDAAPRFDARHELGPWLYAIARRSAIDVVRRERRLTVVDPDETDGLSGAVESPESLERTWEIWQVRLAVDSLAADERDIVRLTWFDGLTHPEVAERLGVPVGTVKSRSHRAHARLAEILAHVRDLGDPDENRGDVSDVENIAATATKVVPDGR